MTSHLKAVLLSSSILLCQACLSSAAISGLDVSGSSMVVDSPNLPANANSSATVVLRVARGDGGAIAQASVLLNVPGCTIRQQNPVSDSNGVVTASVVCATAGEYLTSASLQLFDANQILAPTVALLSYAPADGVSSVSPGTALNIEATAHTAGGAIDVGYVGTVHVSSSDPNASLPADYTFAREDFGNKIWPAALLLYTPGVQTVSVHDIATGALLGTQTFNVEGGQPATLVLSNPAALQAGVPFAIGLRVLDSHGNAAVRYRGTVHLQSSDPNASLPVDYTFTASDAGTAALGQGSLLTAGVQSIWAVDTVQPSLASAHNGVAVQPGPSAALRLTLPRTTFAGEPMLADVQPIDAYGNVTNTYSGMVHFSSPDPLATLPVDTQVDATDITTEHFSNIVLSTSGTGTITVADLSGVLHSGSGTTAVTPGNANSLQLTLGTACASGCAAGTPCDLTLSALDVYGNLAAGYRATVLLTSTDPNAVLPQSYSFRDTDGGSHVLTNGLRFLTAGSRSVAMADITASTLTATTPAVTVSAGSVSSLSVTLPSTVAACAQLSPTVTALDAFGNTAISYAGTVQFSIVGNGGTSPSTYTFGSGDAGQHTFVGALDFTLPAPATLHVADTAASLSGNANTTVVPGPATTFGAYPGDTNLAQGAAPPYMPVSLLDACGNFTADYSGTVQATSSDPSVSFDQPSFTFVQGDGDSWYPDVSFNTLGAQTLTFTDPQGQVQTLTLTFEVYHPCTAFGLSMSSSGVAGVSLGSNTSQSIQASLALTSTFNPVLAWSDNRYGLFYTMVEEYTGSAWVSLADSTANGGIGGQNGNDNILPALALGPGDIPAVAWAGTAPGGGSTTAVLYRKDSGASWAATSTSGQTPGLTGSSSSYQDGVRLAVTTAGTPVVAWRDNGDGSVRVRKYGGGVWSSYGSDPPELGPNEEQSAGALSLALDSSKRPWLAWTMTVNGIAQVYVAHWTGSAWAGLRGSASGNGLSNSTCWAGWPSLVLDGSNNPYVAYNACDSGNYEIYVRTYQAGAWSGMAGSDTGGGISNNAGTSAQPAIALDSNSLPAVVWQDDSFNATPAIYLERYDGTSWNQTNNSGSRTGVSNTVANDVSNPLVVMGQNDVPLVAFTGNNVTYLCGWE